MPEMQRHFEEGRRNEKQCIRFGVIHGFSLQKLGVIFYRRLEDMTEGFWLGKIYKKRNRAATYFNNFVEVNL